MRLVRCTGINLCMDRSSLFFLGTMMSVHLCGRCDVWMLAVPALAK